MRVIEYLGIRGESGLVVDASIPNQIEDEVRTQLEPCSQNSTQAQKCSKLTIKPLESSLLD
jgi:hypothetical protein